MSPFFRQRMLIFAFFKGRWPAKIQTEFLYRIVAEGELQSLWWIVIQTFYTQSKEQKKKETKENAIFDWT